MASSRISHEIAGHGAVKKEKIQSIGIAVPVTVAGVAASAGVMSASMLTAKEQKWTKFLPKGIGKPLAGRVITVLGGSFEMGDLSRVFDVVVKVSVNLRVSTTSTSMCIWHTLDYDH